jgi:alkylmercury lyase
MPVADTPSPESYWESLRPHLRPFSPDEQRAAIALYRELAKGHPVEATQLARALAISTTESHALLQRDAIKSFIYSDQENRVLFGGLAAAPMHHRFNVGGRELSTWCAWDSLFIPEILGCRVHVASPDPDSGEIVRLVVSPDRIESVHPKDAVISFIRPDAEVFGTSAVNVMAKFCHFIFFFASQESGERWIEKHPGTFVYSLDDAFALARRLNAHNFGAELAPSRPAVGLAP